MGLDLYNGISEGVYWSYDCFHDFRNKLADIIGISLNEMTGFYGTKSWDNVEDDIVPLLNHSDCDGELSVEECKKVAPRLDEILEKLEDDDYDKKLAKGLVQMMKNCIEHNVSLKFM